MMILCDVDIILSHAVCLASSFQEREADTSTTLSTIDTSTQVYESLIVVVPPAERQVFVYYTSHIGRISIQLDEKERYLSW